MSTIAGLKKFFKKIYRELLCIEINKTEVKAVVLVQDDKLYAVQTACAELPAHLQNNDFMADLPQLQEFLHNFLAENKLDNVKNILIILAEEMFLTEKFTLPKMEKKEIYEAVKWEKQQLSADTDTFLEQIIIGPERQDEMADVFYYALSKEISEKLEVLSDNLGLKLIALTVNSMGKAALTSVQCRNYLELDIKNSVINVYLDNLLVSKEFLDENIDLKQQIFAVQSEIKNIYNISLEYLMADCNSLQYVDSFEGLKIINHKFTENILWDGKFKSTDELQQIAEAYSTPISAGFMYYQNELLDFLHTENCTGKQQLLSILALGIIGLMIIVCSAGYGISVYNDKQLASLENKLQSLNGWQQKYEYAQIKQKEIARLENTLHKLESNVVSWHTVLEEIGRNIPRNCWIEEIYESKKGNKTVIEAKGRALTVSAIEALADNLQSSKYFSKAEITEIKQRESSTDAAGFTLILYMKDFENGKNTDKAEL